MTPPAGEAGAEGLAEPSVAVSGTGRGVLVAVVDTGVNFDHPHLRLRARGLAIEWEDGALTEVPGAIRDRFGHGTCCAALLHLLAPGAELFAVRVTGDRATTDADRLARGIERAAEEGATLIAVALGTATRARAGLDDAVARALSRGALVVGADPAPAASGAAAELLPARSPGALAVGHRDGVDVVLSGPHLYAEGRARPAPGGPPNFWGASLAVARAAAALARYAELSGERASLLAAGFKKTLTVV